MECVDAMLYTSPKCVKEATFLRAMSFMIGPMEPFLCSDDAMANICSSHLNRRGHFGIKIRGQGQTSGVIRRQEISGHRLKILSYADFVNQHLDRGKQNS